MSDIQHYLKLPTPRLLAYYKKHYRHRRGIMWYQFDTCGYITEEEYNTFIVELNIFRVELNGREHVEK